MIARVAVFFLFFPRLLPAPQTFPAEILDMHLRLIRFERDYNRFFRLFYGCPEDPAVPTGPDTCNMLRGRLDLRAYAKARETAKALFDLEDCRK